MNGTNILGNEAELTRAEWLEVRRQGLGGSDAAAVLGRNPWTSPYALWADKRGEGYDVPETEAMRFGNLMEPHLRTLFAEITGKTVVEDTNIYQSAEHPFMLANLDGLILDDFTGEPLAILEIKTSSNVGAWGAGVPEHYRWQVVHYCAVTGLRKAYVGVLLQGTEFRILEVDVTEQDVNRLISAEAEFWQLVESGTEPELDGSSATRDTLNKRFVPDGSIIDLGDEFTDLLARRAGLKRDADAVAEEIKTIEAAIMRALGESEVGLINGSKAVTWKPQSRTTIDSKALRAEMPEIADKFSKVSTTRVLRITEPKS